MSGAQMSLDFRPRTKAQTVFDNPPNTGEMYRYPGDDTVFTVKSIGHCSVRFECGHWCTDTVFKDLVRVQDEAMPETSGVVYTEGSKLEANYGY